MCALGHFNGADRLDCCVLQAAGAYGRARSPRGYGGRGIDNSAERPAAASGVRYAVM
jgi:hypothetical protein